jgi:hypothetical protein
MVANGIFVELFDTVMFILQETLLKHAEDEVKKWSALCQRLKEQHEKSMYDGIR